MNPNDPKLRSFIEVAPDSDFPIQNLPYGVFSTDGAGKRVGVAIGDFVLDLAEVAKAGLLPEAPAGVFEAEALNPFMALGPDVWTATRARISALLQADVPKLRDDAALRARALIPMAQASLHLPFAVSAFSDF